MWIGGRHFVQSQGGKEADNAVRHPPGYFKKRLVLAGHLTGEGVNTSPDPFDLPALDGLLKISPRDPGPHGIACAQETGIVNERQKAVGSGNFHYET